jgi:leishmanolysin
MSLTRKSILSLLLLSLLFSVALTKDWVEDHQDLEQSAPLKCSHDEQEKVEPGLLEVDEEDLDANHEGRTLASYNKLRMYGYYGMLSSMPSAFRNYLEDDLFPPVLDYFSNALKNKYPVSGKLTYSSSSVCGYSTPSILRSGVSTDFFLIVKGETSQSLGWVANSMACYMSSGAKRPVIALARVNRAYIKETSNILVHEKQMTCMIHEIAHTLGFASSLYKYFAGGSVSSAALRQGTSKVLVAEPLRSRVRKHFGCSTIKGAYMENSGSSGTAGSHFERSQYGPEVMTSGMIYDQPVSELTLALLESSGWYVADYSYADPYDFGKGAGCNFLTQSCTSSSFVAKAGICKTSARSCTSTLNGGGSCSSDGRTDGCKFVHPNVNYMCDNPSASSYARLPSLQAFGRAANSKCFTGTLSTSSGASQTTYCFKYSCSGSGTSTRLNVQLGSKSVACAKAGTVTVSGYKGYINCPDPIDFCTGAGRKTCLRNCMGRGTCNNGVCSCYKGYKGKDCALNA